VRDGVVPKQPAAKSGKKNLAEGERSAGSSIKFEDLVGEWTPEQKQEAAKLLRPMWKDLNDKKEEAMYAAKTELGNRDELFDWLAKGRSLNRLMQGIGLNYTDRKQVVEQMAQVLLRKLTWTQLFGMASSDLIEDLAAIQPLLAELAPSCCSTVSCSSLQVKLLLALGHLGTDEAVDLAETHLQQLRDELPSSGHCLGNTWADRSRILIPQAVSDDKGNLVEMPALTKKLVSRGGSASLPAFWSADQVPLAKLLEEHSAELLQELEPICVGATKKQKKDAFRQDTLAVEVTKTKKDWYSLNLYRTGQWDKENCAKYAPKTCELLRQRPELQGYIKPPQNPSERLVLSYVRLYRLRPGAHLYPHFGKPWAMNVHLGVHIPPGVEIRVWNETAKWRKGEVLSFLDGAEHEVRHTGTEDRFVLSVTGWMPEIIRLRDKSRSFNELFSYD